jgi:hypothetical protein
MWPSIQEGNMRTAGVLLVALLLISGRSLIASGPLGIYGIVDKVVFEPNERAPERVQLWGAFAYVDGADNQSTAISPARRGYMYFRLPDGAEGEFNRRRIEAIRAEWSDLKSVAGTGQAVGFGRWGYIASFSMLVPDQTAPRPSYTYHARPGGGGGDFSDLRVRPAAEKPVDPAVYQTNVGVVKIPDSGRHAPVVKALRAAR